MQISPTTSPNLWLPEANIRAFKISQHSGQRRGLWPIYGLSYPSETEHWLLRGDRTVSTVTYPTSAADYTGGSRGGANDMCISSRDPHALGKFSGILLVGWPRVSAVVLERALPHATLLIGRLGTSESRITSC